VTFHAARPFFRISLLRYAIAPLDPSTSRWFDSVVKVDVKKGSVQSRWSAPGVYLTEFDFLPLRNAPDAHGGAAGAGAAESGGEEDDGLLLTILYNATSDESSFGVFDAKQLVPLGLYPLGGVVPFHAHGIVCTHGAGCYPNP
jgi:carotenoid cleavage dioxygenase-like enzyme